MSTHIFPAKRVKGVFFINGKRISLSDFRLSRYNDLNNSEQSHFKDYLTANKLQYDNTK